MQPMVGCNMTGHSREADVVGMVTEGKHKRAENAVGAQGSQPQVGAMRSCMGNTDSFKGCNWVEITKAYFQLPSSLQISDKKWDRRLAALGIPDAIIRRSIPGDISTLPTSSKERKSIWVPEDLWCAIREGRSVEIRNISNVSDLVRPQDGFVDLTKMLSLGGGRRVDHVTASSIFQQFTSRLAGETNMDVCVKDPVTGRRWVHPRLADFVAMRSDVDFAIKATSWLDAAKRAIPGIAQQHSDAMQQLSTKSARGAQETEVKKRLHALIGGFKELMGPGTRYDIVTHKAVIEVKRGKSLVNVAHAIGQVALYHRLLGEEGKEKRVHVFGSQEEISRCKDNSELHDLAGTLAVLLDFEVV